MLTASITWPASIPWIMLDSVECEGSNITPISGLSADLKNALAAASNARSAALAALSRAPAAGSRVKTRIHRHRIPIAQETVNPQG